MRFVHFGLFLTFVISPSSCIQKGSTRTSRSLGKGRRSYDSRPTRSKTTYKAKTVTVSTDPRDVVTANLRVEIAQVKSDLSIIVTEEKERNTRSQNDPVKEAEMALKSTPADDAEGLYDFWRWMLATGTMLCEGDYISNKDRCGAFDYKNRPEMKASWNLVDARKDTLTLASELVDTYADFEESSSALGKQEKEARFHKKIDAPPELVTANGTYAMVEIAPLIGTLMGDQGSRFSEALNKQRQYDVTRVTQILDDCLLLATDDLEKLCGHLQTLTKWCGDNAQDFLPSLHRITRVIYEIVAGIYAKGHGNKIALSSAQKDFGSLILDLHKKLQGPAIPPYVRRADPANGLEYDDYRPLDMWSADRLYTILYSAVYGGVSELASIPKSKAFDLSYDFWLGAPYIDALKEELGDFD
eukprot:Blabericola_migrator_1__2124@NODE_1587_length_4224_cov_18_054607_g1037_i0_p1_GENE_NODE_1587_length_4224_cov_18_054607_g1037_i0NODE_1587_length_4224_cov_18_054607_g1037_i0_p1_ORF_typecomplete_len414_score84_97_NODE_1587_length_4224_cov_18_054607_g1037_i0371278